MSSEQSHKMSKSSELNTKPESKSAELHKSPTTSKTMRAAVITKVVPDSKVPWDQAIEQTVKIKDRQIQQPRKDEVLVKMMAAGINRRDCFMCIDKYPNVKPPYILGTDMAGIVDKIGPNVDKKWIGKAVILQPISGGSTTFGHNDAKKRGCLAEYVCCNVDRLVEKPSCLTFEEAASLPVCALTAWAALFEQVKITAGDRVLIPGVGGATASMALKIALAAKAQVVVTSSSQQKIDAAKEMGALGGVSYKQPNWPYAAMKLLPEGKRDGFDIVIDGVGGVGFSGVQIACARNARIVSYGGTAGHWPNLNPAYFFMKEISILHTMMSSKPSALQACVDFFVQHKLHPILHHKSFSLEQIHEAMKVVSNNKTMGKVIVTSNGTTKNDEKKINT